MNRLIILDGTEYRSEKGILRAKFLCACGNITDSRVGSREFADVRLNESWKRYHQKHAKLAKVLAEANLAKGASERKTKRYRRPKYEVIIT